MPHARWRWRSAMPAWTFWSSACPSAIRSPTASRIAQLAEAIELIRAMWTQAPANYRGEHYTLTDAYCEPRPDPIPPVMVGGHGETYLLRVVARHAGCASSTSRPDRSVDPGGAACRAR